MFKYSRRGILSRVRNFSSDNSSSGDYYETLGIKRSASQAEVKTAYFELSKKYHPDTAKESPENLQKFREVTDAYEVLGNVDTRKLYDRGLFTEEEFGYKEQETDDPLKRYETARKKMDMGHTFDNWTKQEYQRIQRRRASLRRQEEEYQDNFRSQTAETSVAFPFLLLACGAAFYILFEYNKDSHHPRPNKIENRLHNSPEKKES